MKKPEKKTESKVQSMEVTRAHAFDNGEVIFDAIINDVSIYGCRVVEGKNGDFISFPSRKGPDDKYFRFGELMVSVTTTQLCQCIEKATIDNTLIHEHGVCQ